MYLLFTFLVAFKALILTAFLFILISLLKRQTNLKVLFGLFLTSFIVLMPLNLEKYFNLYPYISTGYSSGFSRENFQKIKAGMSKNEVEQLVGTGFKDSFSHMPQEGEKTCTLYSFDRDSPLTDFAWIGTSVCYDSGEKVTRTSEDPVHN